MSKLSRLLVMGLIAFFGRKAQSAPLAYEGFAYVPGPLPGNVGGVGFAGPWNGDVGVTVQGSVSLVHPLGLPSSGLLVGGGFNVNRPLSNPLPGPIFWASFMIESSPGNDQEWLGLDAAPTQFPFITFGRRLSSYFIQNASNPASTVGVGSPAGVPDLLIARITLGAGTTTVDLWINKNPLVVAPDLTVVMPPAPTLHWVNMQVQNGLLADEVRIGTTVSDVAAAASSSPVPVPPWVGAVLFVVLAFLGMRAIARIRWRAPGE